MPRSANQLHEGTKFEGYYTKFVLESGAKLIIIMCSIPNAPEAKRHNVTITYCSKGGKMWQKELWPKTAESYQPSDHASSQHEDKWRLAFTEDGYTLLAALGTGYQLTQHEWEANKATSGWKSDASLEAGSMTYFVENGDAQDHISIRAYSKSRTPWTTTSTNGPEGWLGSLPFLPLHWHVHSLSSVAQISLTLPLSVDLEDRDREGLAIVHEEKNWAHGFPSAHMWVQAREELEQTAEQKREGVRPGRGVCLAGGRTMGVDAYLIGYRHDGKGIDVDFRPPFALCALGISPFMTVTRNWVERSFMISVQDLTRKIAITAQAPVGSFFTLAAPTPAGFMENSMAQSMQAVVTVEFWERRGFHFGWSQVCKDTFEHASMEFGGDYYPEKGSATRSH